MDNRCRLGSLGNSSTASGIGDRRGNNDNNNNSSTSFCLRNSSCRTDLSIYFQPSRPHLNMFFSYPYTVFSTFYYETDHRKCEMTLGG